VGDGTGADGPVSRPRGRTFGCEAASSIAAFGSPVTADRELEASIRQIVANIDDYKPAAETTVNFAFGKDKLSPDAQAALDKLATDKGNMKRFVVAVEGFTDKVGSTEYNNALSQRRANNVVNYLVTKYDIPLYRIYMVGLGSQKPADEGKTREARSKNRRVEVKIYSADQTMASNSPTR
jgi:outer membrane protein OmpA-like peptidoglycan-associated protein